MIYPVHSMRQAERYARWLSRLRRGLRDESGFAYIKNQKGCTGPCGCETGACCNNGACTQTTKAACAASGGQYMGDGTTCSDNGACCTTCSNCVVENICACQKAGGAFMGKNTTCTPINPCVQYCGCVNLTASSVVTVAYSLPGWSFQDCTDGNYAISNSVAGSSFSVPLSSCNLSGISSGRVTTTMGPGTACAGIPDCNLMGCGSPPTAQSVCTGGIVWAVSISGSGVSVGCTTVASSGESCADGGACAQGVSIYYIFGRALFDITCIANAVTMSPVCTQDCFDNNIIATISVSFS